jgi:hypothetical protein
MLKNTKIIPQRMIRRNNFSKFIALRNEFPYFSYDSYNYQFAGNQLKLQFQFSISDRFVFNPEIVMKGAYHFFRYAKDLSPELLDNLVFHIGMIELVSYWKATCSPRVRLPENRLTEAQANFWYKLYFNGLGEFFYANNINTDNTSFMQMEGLGPGKENSIATELYGPPLVPIGGGKDSAVTVGLLSKAKKEWIPFSINPPKATQRLLVKVEKTLEQGIIIGRQIDPLLLELNEAGYLNGHTPFSAVVAFYSLLAAYLGGSSDIILSNESSANEPTIPGTNINHQYSKTFEFEKDFRGYVGQYLSPSFNYFSLLRPLTELQIASLFAKNPEYYHIFRSCNAGSKTGSWCGKCPKCLFTWIILSPFISQVNLKQIFGKNLLEDPQLVSTLDELTGNSKGKPFECVGTVNEVNTAITFLLSNSNELFQPVLLRHYTSSEVHMQEQIISITEALKAWDDDHFVPGNYLELITNEAVD